MSMNAIFACKLYKASTRKDKIRAALVDPVNSELVQQLKSYLDEEYQTAEYLDPDNATPDIPDAPEEQIIPSEHSSGGGGGFAPSGGGMDTHMSDSLGDDFGDDFESDSSDMSSDVDDTSEDSGEIQLEESTKIKGKITVTSSIDIESDIASQADSIKGMLNAREDTAGVVRIVVKESELWIHYNDDTNLNNVMEPVISVLNAADYPNLQFNRLARTENAIVFSVSATASPVKSIQEVADE